LGLRFGLLKSPLPFWERVRVRGIKRKGDIEFSDEKITL